MLLEKKVMFHRGQKSLTPAQGMAFFCPEEDNLFLNWPSDPSSFPLLQWWTKTDRKLRVRTDPIEGIVCHTTSNKAQEGWLLWPLWCKFLAEPPERLFQQGLPQLSLQFACSRGKQAKAAGRSRQPFQLCWLCKGPLRTASFWLGMGAARYLPVVSEEKCKPCMVSAELGCETPQFGLAWTS